MSVMRVLTLVGKASSVVHQKGLVNSDVEFSPVHFDILVFFKKILLTHSDLITSPLSCGRHGDFPFQRHS
jgi:hypothetical protein